MEVSPENLYKTNCDIISPCALGGAINASTRDQLKCKAIVGAANNQLDNSETGEWLLKNNIVYSPDYLIILLILVVLLQLLLKLMRQKTC